MLNPAAVQVEADPHVFLVGHPPVGEFLGYIGSQTIEGRNDDKAALMDAWRAGNDRVLELEQTEVGFPDAITLGPLPVELEPLVERVLGDPIVQRTYALAPIEIAMVELDRLVVYQKHINVSYADELKTLVPLDADPEQVFRFALPFEQRNDPPVSFGQTADGAWVFKSISNDFRALNVEVIDPAQVVGLNAVGVPSAIVALTVGYGANYLSALHVEGRLVLNNGSHRAYALRDAGHTHVPCLVQRVSRRDELEVLVGTGHPLQAKPDAFLTAKRPPLFKDYFDEQLRMLVHVPRSIRQVTVGFSAAQTDPPA